MKSTRHLFLLSFMFLLLFQNSSAAPNKILPQHKPDDSENRDMKILSWNIYMLPKIVVRRGKLARARTIVEELKQSDFDIIVFQEAFLPKARKIIYDGLQSLYPYNYGPANDGGFTIKTNSGVWVLSKTKLNLIKTTQFKNCKGNDCFARKGAMLLSGTWNNKPFQILGTHLQADGYDNIRVKQMDQIYTDLLAGNKIEGVPQIICGDMNTEREMKEHYCDMLNCLDAQDGEISGVEKCSYDGVNNEIAQSYGMHRKTNYDYILVRNNGSKMRTVKRLVSILQKGKKHLSDHYGIVCELKF